MIDAFARLPPNPSCGSSARTPTIAGRESCRRGTAHRVAEPQRESADDRVPARSTLITSLHTRRAQNADRRSDHAARKRSGDGIGVLDRERAAEATALVRPARACTSSSPRTLREQRQGAPRRPVSRGQKWRVGWYATRCGKEAPTSAGQPAHGQHEARARGGQVVDGARQVGVPGLAGQLRVEARGRCRRTTTKATRRSLPRRTRARSGAPARARRSGSRCSRASARSRSARPETPPRAPGARAPAPSRARPPERPCRRYG